MVKAITVIVEEGLDLGKMAPVKVLPLQMEQAMILAIKRKNLCCPTFDDGQGLGVPEVGETSRKKARNKYVVSYRKSETSFVNCLKSETSLPQPVTIAVLVVEDSA